MHRKRAEGATPALFVTEEAVGVSDPAWKAKPSWYLVVAEDKMIPPVAQRSSH